MKDNIPRLSFADILNKEPLYHNDMNELPEIYRRIEYLRNKGVKMKEIADHTQYGGKCTVLALLKRIALPISGALKGNNEVKEALDLRPVASEQCIEKTPSRQSERVKRTASALVPRLPPTEKENPFRLDAVGRDAPFRTRRI